MQTKIVSKNFDIPQANTLEIALKNGRYASLEKLYNLLSETRKIYAPVIAADKQVEYKYNPAFSDVTFDHIRSTLSVKNVVFPKVENLFTYTNSK